MTTIRIKHDTVAIPISLLDDWRLTPLAKILMVQLLAHPESAAEPGFLTFSMHATGTDGQLRTAAVRLLVECGYLDYEQVAA